MTDPYACPVCGRVWVRGEPMNPRRVIVLTCSAIIALAGLALILLPQTLPAVILGAIMAL